MSEGLHSEGGVFRFQKFTKQLLSFSEVRMTLENEVALEPSEHWGEHPPGTAQTGAGAKVARPFPPHRARAWGWGRWPGWPSNMLQPTVLAQGTGMDFGLLIQLPPIHSTNFTFLKEELCI